MRERLLHALDLGMLGDWDGAKRTLEDLDDPIVPRLTALLTDQQRRERERAEMQAVARHELGNAISIAQANMEALVDGVLEPTPQRLAGIRDAMITCGVLLEDLKKHSPLQQENHERVAVFDIVELISTQVAVVKGIAESKNVRLDYETRAADGQRQYHGDPDRAALIVRDVLLAGVRYTPPGGIIQLNAVRESGEIELSVATQERSLGGTSAMSMSGVSKLLQALGGHARIVAQNSGNATFVLQLPAVPLSS